MIEKPPSSPPGAARKRDLVELRIANLRRELDAENEPTSRAAILYEVGVLYEHELKRLAEAVDYYTHAYAVDPYFQPAVIARVRIAERQPDGNDLPGLYQAHVMAARDEDLNASALIDLALHSDAWAMRLREAIDRSPQPVIPALILEWLGEANNDPDAVRDALHTQAEHAAHPDLGAALWIDLALCEIDSGDIDQALETLEHACESDALIWQARLLQLRTAREHQRWDAFDRAATSLARQLEEAAKSEESSDPLRLPVPERERLPMAAMLWREAASCRAEHLSDVETAADYLDSALRLCPDDRVVRLQALLLAEQTLDGTAVEEASEWFRQSAPNDPAFVVHQIRRALGEEDHEHAANVLRAAAAHYPDSDYANAALDVALMRAQAHAERIEVLGQRAQAAEGEAAARELWRAAQIATSEPGIWERAQELYGEATSDASVSKSQILREALGAALRSKHFNAAAEISDALLADDIDAAERAAVTFTKYEITRGPLRSDQEAQLILRDAMEESNNRAWAPHMARARAAWAGDSPLLAKAHEALASLAEEDSAVGHLCAAGQAYAQSGDWDAAERVLRRALEASPNDTYALSLLQGVLREGGRPEEVVALARERSEDESSSALDELSLLLAGATAEKNENLVAARHAYEEAIKAAPSSVSAMLALLDIARRQNDSNATLRAYASLADGSLEGGVPELFSLLRGDALGFAAEPQAEAVEAYERALEHPMTSLCAAVGVLASPIRFTTTAQQTAAERALAGTDAPSLEQTEGFASAYADLRDVLTNDDALDGDAWLRLSALASSHALRASMLLQGLRGTSIARGPDAIDDLFILAQEAGDLADEVLDAATAIDEALAPGDDAEFRAAALERKLRYSDELGRGALEAAHCRALVEADRGAEAVALLINALDQRPDDLALWETLRNAARQAQQWPLVAQACERLAQFVDGSLKADLLEEAGVVRLDRLHQDQQAEELFHGALVEDPAREVAFRRLHDLLAEKEDADALQDLVSSRLAQGGPKDRLELLYERARLLRGFSDREGALEVLDELFASAPDHVGALALAAEVYVSLERWHDAVQCLQRLSQANITEEQRRVAHLGAADFLEGRLGAGEEALAELRAVEALGLADAQTLARIGVLETSLGRPDAAVEAYRRALNAEPTHELAITNLVKLLEGPSRSTAVEAYEDAIWERVDRGELDASLLEGLSNAASWQAQPARASAVGQVQRALGLPAAGNGAGIGKAAFAAPELNELLQQVVSLAGPNLSKDRTRAKRRASAQDPVHGQLEGLCQRFGARSGVVHLSDGPSAVSAQIARGGELSWVVPYEKRGGLRGASLFLAGRLAWAAPRGAAELLEGSPEDAAGTLAAVLRASRCELEADGTALPPREARLPRSVRRAVRDLVGEVRFAPSELLELARCLQHGADRAGLVVSGDIASALAVLIPSGRTELDELRSCLRALDLVRFWIAADSPLWGSHG